MASSTITVPRSLIWPLPRTRFLTFRKQHDKWINAGGSNTCRFSHFLRPLASSLHLPLSLCTRLLLPRPPLHPLRRPGSPYFRHSLPFLTMATPPASSDSTNPSSTKTERVVIKGLVQGVWYRNWTIENATQLGLKGWVRNRKDGSVEALFSGSPDAVQEMEQRCRRGPPNAVVTGLEVFPSNDDPGPGFELKPTV